VLDTSDDPSCGDSLAFFHGATTRLRKPE
jgi:hypothetical protein